MNTKPLPKFLRRKDWQTACPQCGAMCRLKQLDAKDQRRFGLRRGCGKDIIIELDRVPTRKQ